MTLQRVIHIINTILAALLTALNSLLVDVEAI